MVFHRSSRGLFSLCSSLYLGQDSSVPLLAGYCPGNSLLEELLLEKHKPEPKPANEDNVSSLKSLFSYTPGT